MTDNERQQLSTKVAVMDNRLENIESKLEHFIDTAESRFASKLSEKLVNWCVGLILTSVVTAIIYLVVWK